MNHSGELVAAGVGSGTPLEGEEHLGESQTPADWGSLCGSHISNWLARPLRRGPLQVALCLLQIVASVQDKATPSAVEQAIQAAWPACAWQDVHVVVAVSGGADSVALLLALDAIKRRVGGRGTLHIAHYDHRVRGGASEADAEWVRELADRLGYQSHHGVAPASAGTSEEALRELRHAFLEVTAGAVGARWIATGHHADDQAETVLFRVLRGTGVQGLAGIAEQRPIREGLSLVRPLLRVRRGTLRGFLADRDQRFCEDESNLCPEPTRNWLRHELLPAAVTRMGESVPEALCRLAMQASDSHETVTHFARLAVEAAHSTHTPESGICFHWEPISVQPVAVQIESLRILWRSAGWGEQAMTAAHWRLLAEWIVDGGELPQLPGGVHGRRDATSVVLACGDPPVLP